jgi:hypothetical protein
MSRSNTDPPVSANVPSDPGSPSARVRTAAIWPRVTGSSGQSRSLPGGLQPLVMPASANQPMSAAKT